MEEIVVGIDIGTSKVCTVIGKMNKLNGIEIIGEGIETNNGFKKGVVVDIENTSRAIRSSVKKAELKANLKVSSAYINMIGAHISVINHRSAVDVAGDNREITPKDMERVLYDLKGVVIPENQQIIDIIPRQYIIDGYDEIIDPIGMVGLRLEMEADVIAGKITSVSSIVQSAEKAGLNTDGIVVSALATGEMVLSPEEKEAGIILLDIGAGNTDISIFKNKKLVFNDSIPVGGDHITNDISIGLRIAPFEAEKTKRKYELALTSLIKNDQEISVLDLNEENKKNIKISEVVEIIEARAHEIFFLASELIQKENIKGHLDGGIVLTGGGISCFDGCKQLASEVFDMPVRIAANKFVGITRPEFATAAGIVRYILNSQKGAHKGSEVKSMIEEEPYSPKSIFFRITDFIKKFISRTE